MAAPAAAGQGAGEDALPAGGGTTGTTRAAPAADAGRGGISSSGSLDCCWWRRWWWLWWWPRCIAARATAVAVSIRSSSCGRSGGGGNTTTGQLPAECWLPVLCRWRGGRWLAPPGHRIFLAPAAAPAPAAAAAAYQAKPAPDARAVCPTQQARYWIVAAARTRTHARPAYACPASVPPSHPTRRHSCRPRRSSGGALLPPFAHPLIHPTHQPA